MLTTFTHGIKCFMGLLEKARRHGTVGKTVDSGDNFAQVEAQLSALLPGTRGSNLAVPEFPSAKRG